MQGHRNLQTAFAAGLISGALPDGVTALHPDEAARRYDVYRNNVHHSLTQALATKFPVIIRLVGDAFFAQLAGQFAQTHRPETPILMLWGDAFPAFLTDFVPLAGYPYMADVARIEVARGRAYHAADCTPLSPEALQALAASGGAGPLHLHPSVQVIASAYPALTIWQTHQPGKIPGPLTDKTPECALILRNQVLDVMVHRITAADAAMIAGLQAGDTLFDAAAAAQRIMPGHEPSALLTLLFQTGTLVAEPNLATAEVCP
jgi:hypothetical protein